MGQKRINGRVLKGRTDTRSRLFLEDEFPRPPKGEHQRHWAKGFLKSDFKMVFMSRNIGSIAALLVGVVVSLIGGVVMFLAGVVDSFIFLFVDSERVKARSLSYRVYRYFFF